MRYLTYTLLLHIFIIKGASQNSFEPKRQFDSPANIFITKTIFPIYSTNTSRVDINYNIPKNFLIYTKNIDTTFKAECEISIAIKDIGTNRIEIQKTQNRLFISPTPPEFVPTEYFSGMFSFYLKSGKYRAFFEVRDKESNRSYTDNKIEFEILPEMNNFSEILFVDTFDTNNILLNQFTNISFGESIPFAKPFVAYLEYDSSLFNSLEPEIELYQLKDRKKNKIDLPISFKNISSHKLLSNIDSVNYNLVKDSLTNAIFVFMPHSKLDTGNYELKIYLQKDKMVAIKTFSIQWFDMPKSLRNIQFAIDLLEYIATTEELRQMKVLDLKFMKEKFDAFWKKLDPTPETIYNEAMVEYYKRADYAIEQFSTIRGDNGAKTDRGKIYMLYGKPTQIERVLLPRSVPKEIWTYRRLNKRFIFEDKDFNGNYKLINIEVL